jgi:hypothetical protein
MTRSARRAAGEDDGGAGRGHEIAQELVHIVDQGAIERDEGLVEQQEPRIGGQGAGEGDAALHAAGQGMGPGGGMAGKADTGEGGIGACLAQGGRGSADIVAGGEPGEEARILEDEA